MSSERSTTNRDVININVRKKNNASSASTNNKKTTNLATNSGTNTISNATPSQTLMFAIRKYDLDLFQRILPTASTKHIDQSIMIVVRDQAKPQANQANDQNTYKSMFMFKQLLKHPRLSGAGFKSALSASVLNRQREMLKVILRDKRIDTNELADYILFLAER